MRKMETYLEETNGQLTIKQEYVDKLNELKKAKEIAERELKSLSGAITNELKQHYEMSTRISGFTFTLRGGYWGIDFDLERFKRECPETYIKYLIPKESNINYSLVNVDQRKGKKDNV